MKRLLVPIILLSGCAAISQPHRDQSTLVHVIDRVQKVCLECSEALLTTGGGLLWDVLTVQVSSPEVYAGTSVSVEVLVEGTPQRSAYSQGTTISFSADPAGLAQHRVLLHVIDIRGG
jgi:hypothetical protein